MEGPILAPTLPAGFPYLKVGQKARRKGTTLPFSPARGRFGR